MAEASSMVETSGKEKKTIIFTIGRMNPPTPGHMELIKVMMQANLELPAGDLGHGRVYIILSHSQNNLKDPLPCDRKRDLLQMKGMIRHLKSQHKDFEDIEVTILCTKDPDDECGQTFIISQLCRIIKIETTLGKPPTNMEIILGSDRQGVFDKMIYTYLSPRGIFFNELDTDGIRIFKTYDLKLGRTELADEDEKALIRRYIDNVELPIPITDMSGSLMRALVKNEQKERFIHLYEQLGLLPDDASQLFDELFEILDQKPVEKTVKKSRVKGGRKTRRRTNKRTNNKKNKRTNNKKNKRSQNKRSIKKRS